MNTVERSTDPSFRLQLSGLSFQPSFLEDEKLGEYCEGFFIERLT